MKKLVSFIVFLLFLMPVAVLADSFENSALYQEYQELPDKDRTLQKKDEYMKMYNAEQKVKEMPFRLGDTMDSYLTKRGSIPIAEDLGWKVEKRKYGYLVDRVLLLDGKDYLHYKWKVTNTGEVSPLNERAEKLHKMAEEAKKEGQSEKGKE